METFETYLMQRKKMRPASVEYYLDLTGRFTKWLQSQGIQPDQAGTGDILDYSSYQQNSGATEGVRKSSLTTIRHYYAYLLSKRACTFNPATGLYLKNSRTTVPPVALPLDQLHDLYEQYPVTGAQSLKSKVITGLLVYQGLAVKELPVLTLKHLELKEGRIQIPDQHRINGRTLKLDASQVYYLQKFIEERQLSAENQLLLPPMKFPHNYYKHLLKRLKNIAPKLESIGHIRQSVLQHWAQSHDIRQAQYMAGHRWVSSTQRYDLGSLETLKAEIQDKHPLDKASG
ncbi:MAG: tyrosine-type recombinase/integrase [Desulfotomaculaceae bacterium]